MTVFQKVRENFVEWLIRASGVASIVIVALIFIFLLKEGVGLFQTQKIGDFLLGHKWYPISEPGAFGIFTLILGSILVTLGAEAI